MVTLFPMTVAPVCHVGDTLNLTCIAYVKIIGWSFKVVNHQGRDEEITRFIYYRGPVNQTLRIKVNSTTFSLRRISARFALPHISTLSIDSVSIGLNGTEVSCMNAINSMISASSTIQIIDTSTNNSE